MSPSECDADPLELEEQEIELLFMASYQKQKGQRSKQEFATRVLAKMLSLPTTDLDLAYADYYFFRPNNV